MKKVFLSYCLNPGSPSYGNSDPLQLERVKSLACGDSCNQLRITMNNHLGTHVDGPSHFDPGGMSVDQFPPEFWFFDKVAFLKVSAEPGTLIELEPYGSQIPRDTEFLLIKTGFCSLRGQEVYWKENPGISPESGYYLRKNFPLLRAIGFDLISLSSYSHRMVGRQAHRQFLNQEFEGRPILIVEDMDLRLIDRAPLSLVVLPLRGEGFDGAPVTVVADLDEREYELKEKT